MSDTSPGCCDDNQVDWVARRVACEPVGLLDALKERVQHDVDQCNKRAGSGVQHSVSEIEYGFNVTVRGRPGVANFRVEGRIINVVVRIGGIQIDHFCVRPLWDAAHATCTLAIEKPDEVTPEEPDTLELWQISQRALEKLFFR